MNMKKISIIVTALALFITLAQCKKEQQVAPTNENGTVAILLDIKGNEGTRMDVNTGTGEVTYEEGDIIYVVSSGKFIGTLTHNGTNFSGTITNPTIGEPLYFYYLGNVTPTETLIAGTTQTCSVVISDQTEQLPVIEFGTSNETYTSGLTTFTAFLLNKCALVKFNVMTLSETATCVTGFNNTVSVNFANASFTYNKTNGGNIILPAGSGTKWAILLPQEAMEAGEAGSANSIDGEYTGTRGTVPVIVDNGFLNNGIAVMVNTPTTSTVPTGAINGLFTINSTGDQVYFSQGNLQYQASTNTWRFATNQYDHIGNNNSNISSSYSGWIDLFGWGTSSYNHGAVCYQPWNTSQTNSDYYAYGNYQYNLYDQTGQADWGYNTISNGGNQHNHWRTLTEQEWNYVFYTRTTISGIRYAKAQVNGISGVILLPDNWSANYYSLNNTNSSDVGFNSNTLIASQWNILEQHGAVFLPTTGYRDGVSIRDVSSEGNYWSASYFNSYYAYYLYFYSSGLDIDTNGFRFFGFSVRLVSNIE